MNTSFKRYRKFVAFLLLMILPLSISACNKSISSDYSSTKEEAVTKTNTASSEVTTKEADTTVESVKKTADSDKEKEMPLVDKDWIKSVHNYTNEYGEIKVVPAEGQQFTEAVQVKTTKQPEQPYYFGLAFDIKEPVKVNEVLLASFYARTIEGPEEDERAQTEFVFEQNRDPWEKSTTFGVTPGKEWEKYYVPFIAHIGYDEIPAHITFRFGYKPQTIEIADVEVVNYGMYKDIKTLPRSHITYNGEEADAQWRKEALERIEKIRKADLTVAVKDKDGKPVNNAEVDIKMLKHEFGFGTAVAASYISGANADTNDGKKYQEAVSRLFNKVVIENALKWPSWESWGKEQGIKAVDWFLQKGISVRGHNLVWENWQYLPGDIQTLAGDKEALRKRVNAHIQDEAGVFKDKLSEWDVLNEPIDNNVIRAALGERELASWFKQTRSIDPDAKLYINEYGIEGNDYSNRVGKLLSIIKEAEKNGAPIDGIGIQAHYGNNPPSPIAFLKDLDRLAESGKDLEITEYDISTDDEQLAADFTRDILIASFSHPSVKAFLMWGFWDGAHWHQNAPIYRLDWTLKPSGRVWEDLIYMQWWTNASGATDSNGKYTTRGFKGEYEITVKYGDTTKTVKAKLDKNRTITVSLK